MSECHVEDDADSSTYIYQQLRLRAEGGVSSGGDHRDDTDMTGAEEDDTIDEYEYDVYEEYEDVYEIEEATVEDEEYGDVCDNEWGEDPVYEEASEEKVDDENSVFVRLYSRHQDKLDRSLLPPPKKQRPPPRKPRTDRNVPFEEYAQILARKKAVERANFMGDLQGCTFKPDLAESAVSCLLGIDAKRREKLLLVKREELATRKEEAARRGETEGSVFERMHAEAPRPEKTVKQKLEEKKRMDEQLEEERRTNTQPWLSGGHGCGRYQVER